MHIYLINYFNVSICKFRIDLLCIFSAGGVTVRDKVYGMYSYNVRRRRNSNAALEKKILLQQVYPLNIARCTCVRCNIYVKFNRDSLIVRVDQLFNNKHDSC